MKPKDSARKCSELEKEIVEWAKEMWRKRSFVSQEAVKRKARRLAMKNGITNIKASTGWCTRILWKNNLMFVLKNSSKLETEKQTEVADHLLNAGNFFFFNQDFYGIKKKVTIFLQIFINLSTCKQS